jgi:hypothetical protein
MRLGPGEFGVSLRYLRGEREGEPPSLRSPVELCKAALLEQSLRRQTRESGLARTPAWLGQGS